MTERKTSEAIRREFLEFFRERGHEVVPSASLVPRNDPTLLFTNAGMNQFKDVFLGTGTRPYNRAVNTQKCLRVSGKHNDLEEVGLDTYHHTFFEMLGNWSFGDYFKREAIAWAWELFVDVWGLDPGRLYVTVHIGDDKLGLQPDNEAADLWKSETGIESDHILFGSSKDNFWTMGDTGPCGPCSEIHIDLRSDEERSIVPGRELVNADHPLVMELWNLVFIQYNALPDGSLEPLAAKHVDTGMGFERLVAVLQGKDSNYDTDLFAPLLQRTAELSPRQEIHSYDDIDFADPEERERCRIAMRVIADHIRTIAFAISDGVTPGNVGRAYVIRRILRRAVRFGYQTLGMREPFLYRLVEPLEAKMGATFPELSHRREYVEKVTRAEEEHFLETLGTGIGFFERITPYVTRLAGIHTDSHGSATKNGAQVLQELVSDRQTMDLLEKAYSASEKKSMLDEFSKAASKREVPGEIAFLLHDTYGFPVDLTQLMAREQGLGVDMARYDSLMQQQKSRARAAATFNAGSADEQEWRIVREGDHSEFLGYDTLEVVDAQIMLARRIDGGDSNSRYEIVLDRTPFYAESGGQVGDVGFFEVAGEKIEVVDTQKSGDRIVHIVDRLPDELDAPVRAVVPGERRHRIKKHHTATHLLHAALREILGTHVQQKGSLVAPDRLRFDFSHYERLSPEELRRIEHRVNEAIQRNIPKTEERSVSVDEALERGAMALFGEKYGDRVRVITFDPDFSIELCGGTHVDATGELGVFRFVSEGSVAAGVRRVEAVAGEAALESIEADLDELRQARSKFKALQRPLPDEVAALIDRNKQLEKELESARQSQLTRQLDEMIESARQVDGVRLVTGRVEPTSMDMLHQLGQTLRERLGSGSVAVLGTVDPGGGKVYMVAGVADDLIQQKGIKAGDLVGRLARIVGGGGGGRPTIATAGGKDPEKLNEALQSAENVLREIVE